MYSVYVWMCVYGQNTMLRPASDLVIIYCLFLRGIFCNTNKALLCVFLFILSRVRWSLNYPIHSISEYGIYYSSSRTLKALTQIKKKICTKPVAL